LFRPDCNSKSWFDDNPYPSFKLFREKAESEKSEVWAQLPVAIAINSIKCNFLNIAQVLYSLQKGNSFSAIHVIITFISKNPQTAPDIINYAAALQLVSICIV
jgi:hypothetical protein